MLHSCATTLIAKRRNGIAAHAGRAARAKMHVQRTQRLRAKISRDWSASDRRHGNAHMPEEIMLRPARDFVTGARERIAKLSDRFGIEVADDAVERGEP